MAPPGAMRKGEPRRLAGRGGKSNRKKGPRRKTEGGREDKDRGHSFLFSSDFRFPSSAFRLSSPPSIIRPCQPLMSRVVVGRRCGASTPFFRYASPRRRDGPVAREGRGREGCISFM